MRFANSLESYQQIQNYNVTNNWKHYYYPGEIKKSMIKISVTVATYNEIFVYDCCIQA